MNVLIDVRDRVAEEIAKQRHAQHPARSPENVVGDELLVIHVGHSGHRRRERADDGHETREHDGLRSVFLIESLRPQQMRFFKKQRIFSFEKPRAQLPANPVAGAVAEDRGGHEKNIQQPNVHRILQRTHEAGRDEQRISRKEKSREQAGFGEHDQRDGDVTAGSDQSLKVGHASEKFM